MKNFTIFLLAATLAAAAPTNNTLVPRGFEGSINWFERWDCQNPCVEDGYCLAGQVTEGMSGSMDPWSGDDVGGGCWDKVEGANSLALSVSNGHKFSGINKSCAEFRKDNFQAKRWLLASGAHYGDDECNTFANGHIKAVFYHCNGEARQKVDCVNQNEMKENKLADEYGAPDVYVDGEADTCWYHWTGSIYVKPLRFENRSGCYVTKLKTDPHAEFGKHRHRSMEKAYTLKQSWEYHELSLLGYAWQGKPGDYVTENLGAIHTPYMGADSEVIFDVVNSIEFYNDDNTLRKIMDGFSFWRMYVEHCDGNGMEINTKLWC